MNGLERQQTEIYKKKMEKKLLDEISTLKAQVVTEDSVSVYERATEIAVKEMMVGVLCDMLAQYTLLELLTLAEQDNLVNTLFVEWCSHGDEFADFVRDITGDCVDHLIKEASGEDAEEIFGEALAAETPLRITADYTLKGNKRTIFRKGKG